MASSFFDSFSNFVGKVGNAIGQVGNTVGNFIQQKQAIRLQKAQLEAQLAAAKAQANAVAASRAQPAQLNNAQRAAAKQAAQMPQQIAGISISSIALIVGGIMLYKVIK